MANQHFSDRELGQVMDVLLNLYQKENNYDTLQRKALKELRKRDILPQPQEPGSPINEAQMLQDDERQELINSAFEVFFASCPGYRGIRQDRDQLSIFKVMFNPSVSLKSDFNFDSNDNPYTDFVVDNADNFADILNGSGEAVLPLIILLVVSVAFALSAWALYYLLSQSINGLERIWYNEGWQQAFLPVLTGLAVGTAVGLLSGFFLTAPIAALALAVGFATPIGFIIAGIVCASLFTAAIACFITKQFQDQVVKKTHSNALDPKDPYRFRLTDNEEKRLEAQGLDPFKVKCAIALIHSDMKVEKGVPSRLNRLFSTKNSTKQFHLETIRKLRQGSVEEGELHMQLGDKVFDFNFRGPEYKKIQENTGKNSCTTEDFCNFGPGGLDFSTFM